MRRLPLVLAVVVVFSAGAIAADDAKWVRDADYQACFKAARDDPKEGHRLAAAWKGRSGGLPAEHCEAIAMLGLGYYQEAAHRLDTLAERLTGTEPALAVEINGQAANAWSLAAKPERARAAQSAALKLRPNDVELLVDRSVTQVSLGEYWDAVDDLNRAIDLAPRRADLLALRASAYRRLDTLDLAADDIAHALALEPGHLDALLERGILLKLKGDGAGARRDWLAVLRTRGDSPAADAARDQLERLDVKKP